MTIINLNEQRKGSFNQKRSSTSQLIKDIRVDDYLSKIFSKISSDDLFNILIPYRTALITYSDKEQLFILKSFWKSFEKITSKNIELVLKKYSILKVMALKLIFSSWQEILIFSESANNQNYRVTEPNYFDRVNKFLFSPNENEINTIVKFLEFDYKEKSALDFWERGHKGGFNEYVPHYRQKLLENVIKFSLSCREVNKEFILGRLDSEFKECKLLHYEFNNLNPKKLISNVPVPLQVCFFEKGQYEYSLDDNKFDLGACLSANRMQHKFGKTRYTPFGVVEDKIGFKQKKKLQKPLIDNYEYVHHLKDLEILIFLSSDGRDLKLNKKIPHKYKK
tara:strand:- start:732 stop:1739 length:1008 start_codon:yes stop_codon:yes gene_type:complete